MKLPLRTVAEILGLSSDSGAMVTGWSVDSRTIGRGDLFFALRGPNHDGHHFISAAFEKGAVAVVAESGEGVLRVADSLRALQTLAARARRVWGGEIVAVTGSAGKTTTKDVIAALLAECVPTARSEGNLNNHVGLPLSLLRMEETARVGVVEIGMNHAGEIRDLAAIARPNVGVVTNVGYAHIEFFDSIEAIAAAKRELIEALPAEGVAVLNADDPRVAQFTHPGRTIFYGQSPAAEVRAEDVNFSLQGVTFRVGAANFSSTLTGRHNLSNILAGIAVAGVYGIRPESLAGAVRKLLPGKMRGERFHHRGVLVYNDCYNSNPDAVRAMLDVLCDTPARRRIAVLGEMLELGRWAEPLHRDVGKFAAERGIDVLVGIRGAACCTLDAATRAGLRADAASFFENPEEAGRFVRKIAGPGDAILFKGSRGVRVEKALEEFLASGAEGGF
ncbi:MAG TPA: UDP-N-acetylmuramoyl-tripeptide--D-alanyl-D-alanine ligase [Bryobacteraceae bacterium]|jgi:UDP-N-acetylmuramoyl-tripeptide--D-alanyl-D-alanine ligase|nr:UDP-N-acetylmuramoyl-tripeptide--D-alanyl-D-alanine ligase [Bryobacteraceae bacterium]